MNARLKIRTALRALLVMSVLAAVTSLSAQRNQDKKEDANLRSIEGVVSDADRNPLPRAIVQLKDMRTLQIRSFVTQPEGSYHFAGLRMDTDYELKATLGEQSSATKRVTSFETRKTVTVNLQLEKK
jgi:hypothetical protein